MSKQSVGDVYAKVINDVCGASRVDFEEGGVELSTLDLLKSEWQRKLSGLRVAQLPWDPTPVPTKEQSASSSTKAAAAVPSNGHAHNHAHSPPSSNTTPTVPIKQDAQSYPATQPVAANYPPPQYPANRPGAAQERAAYSLYQQFGNRAGPQIARLQQQQQNPSRVPAMPNQMPPQQAGPYIKQENAGAEPTQDYKPDMTQAVPIKTSQTDGAMDEYESEIARRRAAIAKNKAEGDRLMRAHLMAAQQDLEGGGLLLPLDEQTRPVAASHRPSNRGQSSLPRAQGDATNDDEEDEDAINSDLDDPDELDNPANEEAEIQEVMLCTYDKVQRVKNKWKCTLKDGILRVDGSEYVFHKGQGEFEW